MTTDRDGVSLYTRQARDLLAYAVGGLIILPSPQQGLRCPDPSYGGDPIYNAVTERRHARAVLTNQFYSSCGDLAHWFLYRLGVRFDWINRDEHDGWHYAGQPGHPTWDNNVTTLVSRQVHGVNPYAYRPDPTDLFFACGDVLVVNCATPPSTHVCVVFEHKPEEQTITTADYGQPGAALRRKQYTIEDGRVKLGSRWLDSVLPIIDVLEAADSTGTRAAVETATEWAARLKLPPL